MKTWFISDTHFGHANMLRFVDREGARLRPFSSVEEMNETMVERWNEKVGERDRIYHLGDVVMARRELRILSRLKGRKVLIRGNHDIFKLKDYLPYFDDVRGYKIYPSHGVVCSHIPIHPMQLGGRFSLNVHGHLHSNEVGEMRYFNICVEKTGYAPIEFEEILARKSLRG